MEELSEAERNQIGQLFICGLRNAELDDDIAELVRTFKVGSIQVSIKNLPSVDQARELIRGVQQLAYEAGHEQPMAICIDQEGGILNNLKGVTQFPCQMALAASKDTDLVEAVAEAAAKELLACGVNFMFAPCMDVLKSTSASADFLLGTRAFGDDHEIVSQFGCAFLRGLQKQNMMACGKHFPGYGTASLDSIMGGVPVVSDNELQMQAQAFVPFKAIIDMDCDAIMVGGCSAPGLDPTEAHACLSWKICSEILREQLGFKNVIVSECLEMEALYQQVGVKQGTVSAKLAGCDMILCCSSFKLQKQALEGLSGAYLDGLVEPESIIASAERVRHMKASRNLTWQSILGERPFVAELLQEHKLLSARAYESCVAIGRDYLHMIPFSLKRSDTILLLTPLCESDEPHSGRCTPAQTNGNGNSANNVRLLPGEATFQHLGKTIASYHTGKTLHTSYSQNGIIKLHEQLIARATIVILVNTTAYSNMYQTSITKYVQLLCDQRRIPFVLVAASSPHDMASSNHTSDTKTYVCAFEFTPEMQVTCAKVMFGKLPALGTIPFSHFWGRQRSGSKSLSTPSTRKTWMVETYAGENVRPLWDLCFPKRKLPAEAFSVLSDLDSYVVKNSSTGKLYGFCAAHKTQVALLMVDPSRRKMGIAVSLYKRVQRAKGRKDPSSAQLTSFGSVLPAFFAGATPESLAWLQKVDRAMIFRDNVVVLVNQRLQDFRVDAAVIQELQQNNLRFSISSVAETDAQDLPEELRESDAYVAQCLKDGLVVGSVVLFNMGSSIARWLPWIYEYGPSVGGMTCLRCDSDLIMQGLVCCAMRSFRIEGFQTVVLDHMSVAQRDSLSGLGFSVSRVEEKFSR